MIEELSLSEELVELEFEAELEEEFVEETCTDVDEEVEVDEDPCFDFVGELFTELLA